MKWYVNNASIRGEIVFPSLTLILSIFCMLILTSSISLVPLQNLNPAKNVFAQKGEGISPLLGELKKKIQQIEEEQQKRKGKQGQGDQPSPSSSLGEESMLDDLIAQNILDNKAKKEQITIGDPSKQQESTYDNVTVNFIKSSTTDYKFVILLADGGQVSATLNIKPDVTYSSTAQDIEFANATNATGGKEILNFKKEAGVYDGIFKTQLSYFIPYSELPNDIVTSLTSKEDTATRVVPSSFAQGQMRAATIVPVVSLKAIYNGIAVTLTLDVIDNFLDSHSQISTTTDYVKRIEKLAAIKDCIENPILPYGDPRDKIKLQELFDETVTMVKIDAIGSFVVGVGQGAAFPPLLSIVLNPLFNAEAAVFDQDADNEIATMSKSVGNCKKVQPDSQWKGSFNVVMEPLAPRDFQHNPADIRKKMIGDFSFKILLNGCQNNECKIEGTGNVRAQISTLETKHEWTGMDKETECTEPNQSSALKIIVLGTYIPSSKVINLKMHANFINSPPIPTVQINCSFPGGSLMYAGDEQIDIYQFWYGDGGPVLGDDNSAKIYQLSAISGFTLTGAIDMSIHRPPPHFIGDYKITIFADD